MVLLLNLIEDHNKVRKAERAQFKSKAAFNFDVHKGSFTRDAHTDGAVHSYPVFISCTFQCVFREQTEQYH